MKSTLYIAGVGAILPCGSAISRKFLAAGRAEECVEGLSGDPVFVFVPPAVTALWRAELLFLTSGILWDGLSAKAAGLCFPLLVLRLIHFYCLINLLWLRRRSNGAAAEIGFHRVLRHTRFEGDLPVSKPLGAKALNGIFLFQRHIRHLSILGQHHLGSLFVIDWHNGKRSGISAAPPLDCQFFGYTLLPPSSKAA